MSLFRKARSKLYRNSRLLQYLWLRHEWKKRRKNAEHEDDLSFALRYHYERTGKKLDLDNPQTFDEKLWYLKLHNRDPLLTICSDKYKVREYVEQCGLGHILNELYGAYDDARDIDFDTLPSPCFLKCNHTSGVNVIYDRSKPFDKRDFIRTFNFMLKQNYYWASREWNYKDIPTKITAERVLRDEEGMLPVDYRFFCFHGAPKLLYASIDASDETGKHSDKIRINFYDLDFHLLNIKHASHPNFQRKLEKPEVFEKMKEYAAILSKPFPFCRVDLYYINGKVYFGEMTFYPGGGSSNYSPYEWNLRLGSWIDITDIKQEKI